MQKLQDLFGTANECPDSSQQMNEEDIDGGLFVSDYAKTGIFQRYPQVLVAASCNNLVFFHLMNGKIIVLKTKVRYNKINMN